MQARASAQKAAMMARQVAGNLGGKVAESSLKAQIAELRHELQERDARLEELEMLIAESRFTRSLRIMALKVTRQQAREALELLEKELREANETLQQKDGLLQRQDSLLAQKDAKRRKLELELENVQAERAKAERRVLEQAHEHLEINSRRVREIEDLTRERDHLLGAVNDLKLARG